MKLKYLSEFSEIPTSIHHYSVYKLRFLCFSNIWFKILGLSPWTIDTGILRKNVSPEEKNFKCKLSFWGTFYNVFLVTLMLITDIWIIYHLSLMENSTRLTLETVTVKLSFVSIICASIIPIIYVFRQKLLVNMNNRFEGVNRTLSDCSDYSVDDSNNNYLIFTMTSLLTSGIIVLRVLYYLSSAKVFVISLPYFISSWLIVQFVMFLNMIKVRITSVNNTLSKLGTTDNKILLSRESVLNDIFIIKRDYVEICEISDGIMSFFGLPILIVIIIFSIRSIFNFYYIILILIHIQEIDLRLYEYGLFLLRNIFLFLMMTSNATEIIKQNRKTARIINLLIDRYLLDKRIKNKFPETGPEHRESQQGRERFARKF
ncbi:GSCOCT00010527001.3-RA-CDS [Cotesia congregata]|uniref:Gustatory receptor n=1 Tax=Cotesia congregata TaxID=51543 RepID=A0A8J2H597_COTCN|nr:GSCOCT00010527001.3-RA-CDS [Cotesia congregata]CAG5075366.1 gustatory receptor 52 [Cotesia congregata]